MKIIKITESQYKSYLCEDVFINDTNLDKKTAQITYKKRASAKDRNIGNKKSTDLLKTDKMDTNDSSTHIIMLKGGIKSYNITDIKGMEVMHYFKNYFDKTDTLITIDKKQFQLEMEDNEFKEFMTQFITKVDYVIDDKIKEYKRQNKDINFTKVCIYPVPSSKKFNIGIANRLVNFHFCGIPQTIIVDSELLKKDMAKLNKDEEFINKNHEFYNDKFYKDLDSDETNIGHVDTELAKKQGITNAQEEVENVNKIVTEIYNLWEKNKNSKKWWEISKKLLQLYKNYEDALSKVRKASIYKNYLKNNKDSFSNVNKILELDKEKTTFDGNEILNSFKYLLPNSHKPKPIQYWKVKKFQIKSMPNQIRMGLKNFYSPNQSVFEKEKGKMEGAIVVVFDDNVSGGATLSDVCYQLQQIGVEYQVPITLGKMATSYRKGIYTLNQPKNDFNY